MFKAVWDHEKVLREWTKGGIVEIPKKGDTTICDNYRGFTLLSVPSKILGKIIIGRIREGIDGILRNRLDLEGVEGIPDKLIRMVMLLYDNTECAVIDNGVESEWFTVRTGVKQGCVMSGFLFLLSIDWVMRRTVSGEPSGIRWNFTTKLEDLDFADDLALIASKYQDIQRKTANLKCNAERIGLKINTRKTKIMRFNTRMEERVRLDEERLEDVEQFTYLGRIVSKKGGCDEDIRSRLGEARAQFNRMQRIWNSPIFSIRTKVRLFNTIVISVLIYGCDTWKMNEGDKRKLDSFQNN